MRNACNFGCGRASGCLRPGLQFFRAVRLQEEPANKSSRRSTSVEEDRKRLKFQNFKDEARALMPESAARGDEGKLERRFTKCSPPNPESAGGGRNQRPSSE